MVNCDWLLLFTKCQSYGLHAFGLQISPNYP